MWVFGYGSLMWDGWEVHYAGRRSKDGSRSRVKVEIHLPV